MNKRYYNNDSTVISRLADQAHETSCSIYDERLKKERADAVIFYDIFNQKFAELIVRECMRMCEVTEMSFVTHDCDVEASGAITVKQFIAEHFGVDTEIDTNKKIEESLHKADKDIQEGLRKQYLEQLTRLNGDLS